MQRQLCMNHFLYAQDSLRQTAIEGELTSFFRGRKLDYTAFFERDANWCTTIFSRAAIWITQFWLSLNGTRAGLSHLYLKKKLVLRRQN